MTKRSSADRPRHGAHTRRTSTWIPALLFLAVVVAAVFFYASYLRQFVPAQGPGAAVSTPPLAQTRTEPFPTAQTNWSVVATNVDNPTATRNKDSAGVELLTRANALLAKGDTRGAIQVYQEALALTPDDEDLHFNLGVALGGAGDSTNAEHEYREALRLLPDYPEAHNNLGNLLLHSGRLAEAEEEFLAALKAMPEHAMAHNNLGIIRQRQNRRDEAIACFQRAIQYDTNYWQAHFNLASAYISQKQIGKAIPELRETLRLNPSFEPAQRELSRALTGTAQPQP